MSEGIWGNVQGWTWVDEGRDGRHKYGYVTEEADHDITFVVSPFTSAVIAQTMHHLLCRLWQDPHI